MEYVCSTNAGIKASLCWMIKESWQHTLCPPIHYLVYLFLIRSGRPRQWHYGCPLNYITLYYPCQCIRSGDTTEQKGRNFRIKITGPMSKVTSTPFCQTTPLCPPIHYPCKNQSKICIRLGDTEWKGLSGSRSKFTSQRFHHPTHLCPLYPSPICMYLGVT
jgi:hypothetical protein